MVQEPGDPLEAAHVDGATERVVAAVVFGAAGTVQVDRGVAHQHLQHANLPVAGQMVHGVVIAQAGAALQQQLHDRGVARPAGVVQRGRGVGAVVQQQRRAGHPVLLAAGRRTGAVLQRQPGPVAGVGVGPRGGGAGLGQEGGEVAVPGQHRGGVQVRLRGRMFQQQRQELGAAERRHRDGAVQMPAPAQQRIRAVLQQQPHAGEVARRLGHGALVLHRPVQRPIAMRGGGQNVDVRSLGDQKRGHLGLAAEAGVHQQRPMPGDRGILGHCRAHRLQLAGQRRSRGAPGQILVHNHPPLTCAS